MITNLIRRRIRRHVGVQNTVGVRVSLCDNSIAPFASNEKNVDCELCNKLLNELSHAMTIPLAT